MTTSILTKFLLEDLVVSGFTSAKPNPDDSRMI
jgi:hypothetical protein